MLGFVRFLSPKKVRFYEVLSLLFSCAGLLYISEKSINVNILGFFRSDISDNIQSCRPLLPFRV